LGGEALVERTVAGTIPNGDTEGGVVGKAVSIVLSAMSEGERVEALMEEDGILVANLCRIAGIE
jgi:hypothetical protein